MNLVKIITTVVSFLYCVSSTFAQHGREYVRYPFYINTGIPYFKADSLSNGTLEFDGDQYDSVKLMYDQVTDELITTDHSGANLLVLVKQKVSRFSLFGTSFIYLPQSDNLVAAGYYEVLHNGKTQLLKKEIKTIVDEVKMGENLQKKIQSRQKYYLGYNGKFYTVNSTRSIITALGQRKTELKDLIRKNKINEKKNPEEAMKTVLNYYDQLTN